MSVMKCLGAYFRKHPFILLFILLIVMSVTALSLVPPQILRIIVDEVLPSKDYDAIMIYAFIYMSLFILVGVIDFLKEVMLVVVSQGFGKKIRLEMLSKVRRMAYTDFSVYDSGTLESYFSNDVDEINTLITSGVISMVIDGFKMIGIVVSIFIFSYMFGFITLGVIPFIVLFTMWVRKRMFQAQRANRKLEGNVNNLVLENLDNVVTIKSFRIYECIKAKYNEVLRNHFKANQKANNYDAMFSPIMNILKYLLIVLIICLSTANHQLFGMTVGMLVSSIDLITSLFSPIESIGMELQTIQKSMAAISRINEFFKLPEEEKKIIQSLPDTEHLILEFNDVTFAYDDGINVIEHFNLRLEGNERLTLVGKSGSGKSTLFKLAYGLIRPSEGRVTINGMDTYLLSDEVKRKYFGIVYQDYFFSGGAIRDEIRLMDRSVSDEKIYEVLKMVGLDRIQDIHQPLKVTDYSTGELSLFNIARAIIFDSRILFLDEMNAKIDSVSAKKIMDVINKVSEDKIVLSINHYGDLLVNSQILKMD